MENRKRKREEEDEEEDAIITFNAPGNRTYERVFQDQSLDDMKNGIRWKLGLDDDVEISLAQTRNGRMIDLEDEDDFKALRVVASARSKVEIKITVGPPRPILKKKHIQWIAEPTPQYSDNEAGPFAPSGKRKRALTNETTDDHFDLPAPLEPPPPKKPKKKASASATPPESSSPIVEDDFTVWPHLYTASGSPITKIGPPKSRKSKAKATQPELSSVPPATPAAPPQANEQPPTVEVKTLLETPASTAIGAKKRGRKPSNSTLSAITTSKAAPLPTPTATQEECVESSSKKKGKGKETAKAKAAKHGGKMGKSRDR